MSDPTSPDDFEARYAMAYVVTGAGLNATTHVPCPFCAAADWMVHGATDAKQAMTTDHTCRTCGRSARFLVVRAADGAPASAELVQTGGPEPPAWMNPPRRVERVEGRPTVQGGTIGPGMLRRT